MKLRVLLDKILVPLLITLVGFGFLMNYFGTRASSYCWVGALNYCEVASLSLLPVVMAAVIGIVLLFMNKKVYASWSLFSYFYLPISFLWIFFSPEDYSGFLPYDKFTLALPLTVLFVLISLLLISYKSFQLYRKK
jgi:hypothetical protein